MARRVASDNGQVERVSPRHATAQQLKRLWDNHEPRFRGRNARIRDVRLLYAGQLAIEVPANISGHARDYMVVSSPDKQTVPLKVTSLLQEKPAKLRREPGGTSPVAQDRATTIERWINALMGRVNDGQTWATLSDLALNEGECAVIAMPSLEHWEDYPDFLDTVDEAVYRRMRPARQGQYRPRSDRRYERVNARGETQIRTRYQRDESGRPAEHADYGGTPDVAKSRAAWAEERTDFLTRRPPFEVRLIPADDCMPLYGPGNKLRGLLVRTFYTREELIESRYAWSDETMAEASSLAIPAGNANDRGGYSSSAATGLQAQGGKDFSLYEAWLTDPDGKPYVVYSVNGLETYFTDQETGDRVEAVHDLYAQYGLSRLPCRYVYGMHFTRSNPDNPGAPLGMPFMWPMIRALLGRDRVLTGASFQAWNYGLPGYFVEPDAQLFKDLGLDLNTMSAFEVQPNQVTPVWGKVVPAVAPALGEGLKILLAELKGSIQDEGPSELAFGGGGASATGRARVVAEDQYAASLGQVYRGCREAWEWLGELLLELGCRIGEITGVPIPVYANVPTSGDARGRGKRIKTTRAVIALDPEIVGPVYDVTAYYPREFGENLAKSQLGIQAWKDGASSFTEMREEGFEDEAPEETLAQIIIEGYLLGTREIPPDLLALVAAKAGDEEMSKRFQLMLKGELSAAGDPMALYAGTPGAQLAAPGAAEALAMPVPAGAGMGMPNIAGSMLGGQVAAEMQTGPVLADAMATGGVPQGPV